MLSSWRIKNFKAWQDSSTIKLAPLTVFFGENSAGKSSLGQLLLALKQSAATQDPQAALNFGEQPPISPSLDTELDLGSFAQNLHQNQLTEPLKFELKWHLAAPQVLHDIQPNPTSTINTPLAIPIDELQLQVSVLADDNRQPQLHTMSYIGYQQGEAQLTITHCASKPDQLQVEVYQSAAYQYEITLASAIRPQSFYQFSDAAYQAAPFLYQLSHQTEQILASFQSLAALRAAPQRRYLCQAQAPSSVGRTGQLMALAILSASAEQRQLQFGADQPELPFIDGISYWLQQMGMAHHIKVQLAPNSDNEYQVLLKQHAGANDVNLADLGFGVSQLLPVIVQAFYAKPHSTLWLEQPEIHLHSQVQAGLADMLIAATQAKEAGQNRNVQVVVESHSEHFLNRLQRRIAEGVIAHTDVALYFCRRQDGKAHIEPLAVDTYGEIANWPENLFGDEMSDIAARAMAAVQRKRQPSS